MCTPQDLISIFTKSIEAVLPPKLIKEHIYLNGNTLHVYDKTYHISKNCYIVGFGKAVYEMSIELEKILGQHLVWGFVSIPFGMKETHPGCSSSRVVYMEGAANNLPDKYAEKAAIEIADLAEPLTKDDLLFVLISGGGSALLPAPPPSINLRDKTNLIKLLANRGADIIEINCVRKKISTLKGGGLACLAHPAKVVSLILSDVIGDPLDFIASGPTVPNQDPPELAEQIILKYIPKDDPKMPESIRNFLHSSPEPPKKCPQIVDGNYEHVRNFLIGNNTIAIGKAAEQARKIGYDVTIMSNSVSANVETVSKAYRSIAIEIYQVLTSDTPKKILGERLIHYKETLSLSDESITRLLQDLGTKSKKCLVFGGEPTVLVKGTGKGGRNQHLALQFSINLDHKLAQLDIDINPGTILFLSGGTDGIDGPTDAAGAIGFNGLCKEAADCKLDVDGFLARNDSYSFYKKFQSGKYLLRTGHTGTNVMDVHVLLVNI